MGRSKKCLKLQQSKGSLAWPGQIILDPKPLVPSGCNLSLFTACFGDSGFLRESSRDLGLGFRVEGWC